MQQRRPFPDRGLAQRGDRGLRIANEQLVSVMTLMVGNPDETDEDCMATLDLIYESSAAAFCDSRSIFTPLHDTRMERPKVLPKRADSRAPVADHHEVLEGQSAPCSV
jgi:hypothetical protein